jgi:hypothetical protein
LERCRAQAAALLKCLRILLLIRYPCLAPPLYLEHVQAVMAAFHDQSQMLLSNWQELDHLPKLLQLRWQRASVHDIYAACRNCAQCQVW